MLLKTACNVSPALNYLIGNLNIQSSTGLKYILNNQLINDRTRLEKELNKVEKVLLSIKNDSSLISNLGIKFCRVRDINGTINNLFNNTILDDIELFEIKSFCLLSEEIKDVYRPLNLDVVEIPDLSDVITILDPDNNKIPAFFVYDSYSEELSSIRKKINIAISEGNKEEEQQLRFKEEAIEDEIRAKLSQKLFPLSKKIQTAVTEICKLDVLIAKAQQAYEQNFCKPNIIEENEPTTYKGLYNPQIKDALAKNNIKYQAIDITLYKSPCLITGANMSGKTVLLKTIALTQLLTQFGFFVPAKEASVAIVDEIMICMDESDNDQNGLSSFAAEILKINDIVNSIKEGSNILVLVDELARTTNPVEGRKIVSATLEFLDKHDIRGLITSHYGDIEYKTRRLRVKGLEDLPDDTILNVKNINSFIDYSLVETDESEVPQEAIRIAAMLGVNDDFIKLCNKY